MPHKWTFSSILIIIVSFLSLFLVGFKLTLNKTPTEVYGVYLEGKKIGAVKSKESFEDYINIQEEKWIVSMRLPRLPVAIKPF